MIKHWEVELKSRIIQDGEFLFVQNGRPHNNATFMFIDKSLLLLVGCLLVVCSNQVLILSLVGMACPAFFICCLFFSSSNGKPIAQPLYSGLFTPLLLASLADKQSKLTVLAVHTPKTTMTSATSFQA